MSIKNGGANSDRINCGSGTSLDDLAAFTWMLWVYPTSDTGAQTHISKASAATGRKSFERKSTDVNDFDSIVNRVTTNAGATTTGVNRPLNAWLFIALSYDGTDGPRVWTGNLTTPIVQASYSARTVGVGTTRTDNASDLFIGNRDGTAEAFVGKISHVGAFNRRLTQGEIRSWQFNPRKMSGCILYMDLGFNGTSTQPDHSGNFNAGTVTGGTQDIHAPIRSYFTF